MDIINVILNFIIFIVIFQLTTIVHEFGHAIPALLYTQEEVNMVLGRKYPNPKTIKFKRFVLEINSFHPFTGFVFYNYNNTSRLQKIILSAGGPAISLIVGLSLIIVSSIAPPTALRKILLFSGCYNIYQFLCTAVPIIYPKWWGGYGGYSSDGYKVVQLIKNTN